ncbi:MAG: RHS repeat protein, partial [Methylococcaceae bacterium]|nr:RHS repeat protein [Methylococcaceae bacterium]
MSVKQCLPLLLSFIVITPSYAISPSVKYGGYNTALEAEYAFFNAWIAAYGKTQCSFGQLTWIDTPTAVNGYIPFSSACGYGHVLPVVIPKTVICPTGSSYDLPTNNCQLPVKSNGPSTSCGVDVANPINASTGNKWQHDIDLPPLLSGLGFERYYNAGTADVSANQGVGWRNTYARAIVNQPSGSGRDVFRPDGKKYSFTKTATGFTSDADITEKLNEIKNASGMTTGWQYTTADNDVEIYDANGTLLSITDRAGLTQTLAYSIAATPVTIAPTAGLLIQVTDAFGRQLNFTYDSSSRIATMTDPASGNYTYTYNASNNLSSVTYPDLKTRTYLYNEPAYTAGANLPNALTGIIDENSKRFATYNYDAQGRAISSEHAGGVEKYSMAFSADGSSTAITDPLGSVRTTHFASILGVVKSTGTDQPGGSGCAAASNNITYDVNGNIASRTDFNNHRSNYIFDLVRNLETSRTEGLTAAGANTPQTRTILTEWHPSFRLPTKITEPSLETTYSYDSHGQITQKTLKDTVTLKTRSWTITYTYSTVVPGALLQKVENGPRTDVADITTTDYYAPDAVCTGGHFGCRGQISKITNALGHSTQITGYNAHGQPETVIDANGLTTSLGYDPRQRLISMTSGGELTQFKYDNAGQFIRLTRPDASFLAYDYDDAHRLTQVSDNRGNKIVYTLDAMGNRLKEDTTDPTGQLTETRRREVDALNRLAKAIGVGNQTTVLGYDSQGNLTDIT